MGNCGMCPLFWHCPLQCTAKQLRTWTAPLSHANIDLEMVAASIFVMNLALQHRNRSETPRLRRVFQSKSQTRAISFDMSKLTIKTVAATRCYKRRPVRKPYRSPYRTVTVLRQAGNLSQRRANSGDSPFRISQGTPSAPFWNAERCRQFFLMFRSFRHSLFVFHQCFYSWCSDGPIVIMDDQGKPRLGSRWIPDGKAAAANAK